MSLEYIKRCIRQLLVRGLVKLTKDSGDIQELQVSTYADDVTNKVERFSEFGFSSNVPLNSECVVVAIGSSKEHSIVVATNHRKSRPKDIPVGSTMIYDQAGNKIHIKNDGTIEVVASTKVTVDAPDAEFTGNVKIKGNLVVEGTSNLQQDVSADSNLTVGGDATIGGNNAVTGDVTAANVAAVGAVGGSAIAAPSISVAGTELAAYGGHTHTDSVGGTTSGPS